MSKNRAALAVGLATALTACGVAPAEERGCEVAPDANHLAGQVVNDNACQMPAGTVVEEPKAVEPANEPAPSRFRTEEMEMFEGRMLVDDKADFADARRIFAHSDPDVVELVAELLRRSDLANASSDEIIKVFDAVR